MIAFVSMSVCVQDVSSFDYRTEGLQPLPLPRFHSAIHIQYISQRSREANRMKREVRNLTDRFVVMHISMMLSYAFARLIASIKY